MFLDKIFEVQNYKNINFVPIELASGILIGKLSDRQHNRYVLKSTYRKLCYLRKILSDESIVDIVFEQDNLIIVNYNTRRKSSYDRITTESQKLEKLKSSGNRYYVYPNGIVHSYWHADKGIAIHLMKSYKIPSYIPTHLYEDRDIFIEFIKSCCDSYNPFDRGMFFGLSQDTKLMKKAIRLNAKFFKHMPMSIKSNRKIIKYVVQYDASLMSHIDRNLKHDDNFMLELIKINHKTFYYMLNWHKNRSFVIKAMAINKLIFKTLSKHKRKIIANILKYKK
jgi:hypothetical protein